MIRSVRLWAVTVCGIAAALSAAAEPSALDREQLEAMIQHAVRSRAEGPIASLEIPALDAFVLEEARPYDVSISSHPGHEPTDRLPLTITVSDRGRVLRQGVVTVRVNTERAGAEANPHAGRTPAPGAATEPTRPALERPVAAFEAAPAPAPRQVTRRTVRSRREAEPEPAVRRGDRVRMVLRHRGLLIESEGRALEDAAAGQPIRVRSRTSKREVLGRLSAEGVVHVDL